MTCGTDFTRRLEFTRVKRLEKRIYIYLHVIHFLWNNVYVNMMEFFSELTCIAAVTRRSILRVENKGHAVKVDNIIILNNYYFFAYTILVDRTVSYIYRILNTSTLILILCSSCYSQIQFFR